MQLRPVPEILREGATAHGPSMVVRALPCPAHQPRRAVIASRKIGGAVVRNRAKRRLREALRAVEPDATLDVVLIARAAALSAPMANLVREVDELTRRVQQRLEEEQPT